MTHAKDYVELQEIDPGSGWQAPPHYPPGMEEKILNRVDVQARELFFQLRSDTAQRGDRQLGKSRTVGIRGQGQSRTATASISTLASFGSAATPMAARAG